MACCGICFVARVCITVIGLGQCSFLCPRISGLLLQCGCSFTSFSKSKCSFHLENLPPCNTTDSLLLFVFKYRNPVTEDKRRLEDLESMSIYARSMKVVKRYNIHVVDTIRHDKLEIFQNKYLHAR